jgi:UDP-2,4-diacetamido-2,4,6-trideoxy-beta-L-altropyranose hydrolase
VSAETARHAARLLEPFEILVLDGADEAAAMATRWPEGADWLVLDHYGRDAKLERACRPWATRILVLDDLADRTHDCDLLLDSGLTRRPEDYAGLVPQGTRLLLGPGHALLKPQFAAKRPASLARRGAGRLARVLVSFGLGEVSAFTAMALYGVRASGLDLAIDVVVGPGVSVPAAREPGIAWHQGLSDLSGLMMDCDLAIGAGGTTSWERSCLGVPSLLAMMAENQRDNIEALVARGAARQAQNAEAIAAALRAFDADPASLAAMARAAAALCDGGGAGRVIAAMR